MAGRYEASGPEAEFQPGSRGRVLRNRLGIASVRELERKESEALLAATQQIIDETTIDQRFTADDLRRMHRRWLGEIYEWAGEYRGVNIAKGEFMFAAATQAPRLMQEFERGAAAAIHALQVRFDRRAGNCTRDRACRVDSDPPISRRKRALCQITCNTDGTAGRIAGAGFRRDPRREETQLLGLLPSEMAVTVAGRLDGPLERRSNSLDGGGRGDGPRHRSFPYARIA